MTSWSAGSSAIPSPSWFAPDTRLQAGEFYLPQRGSAYEAFELSGKPGRERMIAIVSDEPLGRDWLSSNREAASRTGAMPSLTVSSSVVSFGPLAAPLQNRLPPRH